MRNSLLLVLAIVLASLADAAVSRNGFDLSKASIPTTEIRRRGPPKDSIPAVEIEEGLLGVLDQHSIALELAHRASNDAVQKSLHIVPRKSQDPLSR